MSKSLDFFDISDEQIKNDVRGARGAGNLLSLEEGDTLVRIMPPWAQGGKYYREYKMHFALPELVNFGLEVDGWFNSPCLTEKHGKCPLCGLANKAKALGNRNNDLNLTNLSKQIRAKQQYVANVVNVSNPEAGVLILPFGKKVFEALQAIFARKGNITHPVTGFNVVITKRKIPNQQWFDYSVSTDERVDISEQWDTFKGQIHDLDAYPKLPEYDDVATKVAQIELIGPTEVYTTAPVSGNRIMDNGYIPGAKSRTDEFDTMLDEM